MAAPTAVKPDDCAIQPGDRVMRPADPAIKPAHRAVKPDDYAVKPGDPAIRAADAAIEPGNLAIRHADPAIKPVNCAIEPADRAIEPADCAVKPAVRAIEPVDCVCGSGRSSRLVGQTLRIVPANGRYMAQSRRLLPYRPAARGVEPAGRGPRGELGYWRASGLLPPFDSVSFPDSLWACKLRMVLAGRSSECPSRLLLPIPNPPSLGGRRAFGKE